MCLLVRKESCRFAYVLVVRSIALVLVCFVAFPTRLGVSLLEGNGCVRLLTNPSLCHSSSTAASFSACIVSLRTASTNLGCLLTALARPTVNGVARWGFDGIIQDVAVIRGDAVAGTGIPTFFPTSVWQGVSPQSPTGDGLVRWSDLPADQPGAWDGFALLVDDVLRYAGPATSFNLSTLAEAYLSDDSIGAANLSEYPGAAAALQANIASQPHWLRLAYSLQGVPGDYTRAATVYWNSTFIEAPRGRT